MTTIDAGRFSRLGHIDANWPAPENVHAGATTRRDGFSETPYDDLNLGFGTDDDPENVTKNRKHLAQGLGLMHDPIWLKQQHGPITIDAGEGVRDQCADASFAFKPGVACVVLTADCMPVLFCDRAGTRVAAAHAGWRGLAGGILETVLNHLALPPEEVLVWLGPAISQAHFEVGPEVRQAFEAYDPGAGVAFKAGEGDREYADLFELARRRMGIAGVDAVYGGGICTYSDEERFFSYRRDVQTGRMANLIWMD